MGMFDWVEFESKCPGCGEPAAWQSKDGPCELGTIKPDGLDEFYGGDCAEGTTPRCADVWIRYVRKESDEGRHLTAIGIEEGEIPAAVESDLPGWYKLDFTVRERRGDEREE